MATRIDRKSDPFTILLEQLKHVKLCCSLGTTMSRYDEPLRAKGFWAGPTEYERAREIVIELGEKATSKAHSLRKKTLDKTLIQTENIASLIVRACKLCLDENQERIANGKKFECIILSGPEDSEDGSRRLDLGQDSEVLELLGG